MVNAKSVTTSLSGFVSNNKIVTKVAEEAKLKGVELIEDTAAAAREAMSNSVKQTVEILETIRPEVVPLERRAKHTTTLHGVPLEEETVKSMRAGYSKLDTILGRINAIMDNINSRLMPKKQAPEMLLDIEARRSNLFEDLAKTQDPAQREEIFVKLAQETDWQEAAKAPTAEIELSTDDLFDVTPVTVSNPFIKEAIDADAELLKIVPIHDPEEFILDAKDIQFFSGNEVDNSIQNAIPEIIQAKPVIDIPKGQAFDDVQVAPYYSKLAQINDKQIASRNVRISELKEKFETLKKAEGITHTPLRKSPFSEDLSVAVQTEDNARIAQEGEAFQNQEIFKEASRKIQIIVANTPESVDPRLQPRPFIEVASDVDVTIPNAKFYAVGDEPTQPFAIMDNLNDSTIINDGDFEVFDDIKTSTPPPVPVTAKKAGSPILRIFNNPTPEAQAPETREKTVRQWVGNLFNWTGKRQLQEAREETKAKYQQAV